MVLIIRLKLDWSYFNLGVRRNIRNSLIKYDDEGWTVLGTPGMNEDKATVNFLEDHDEVILSDSDAAIEFSFSENKDEISDDTNDENGVCSFFEHNMGFTEQASEMPD